MPDTFATRTLEAGAETSEASLKLLLVIVFLLNVVLQGGMRYMLLLIRALQIVLHIPLLRIAVPAHVAKLFSSTISVATFDVLDPEWTTQLLFNFDDDRQGELQSELLDQMEDLGYETHNAILNLGSLAIFTFFYFCELAIVGALLLRKWLIGRSPAWLDSMKQRLIFGDLLAILLDAYFEFLISGYLQLREPLDTTGGEVVSVVIGSTGYLLILGFMTFSFVKLMATPMHQIQTDPEFGDRWG
mmetsp:Transcript_27117/g.41271  ORF Transcript_27117/g.41271 Transcript_27117/m.41271 type:complete len:244 (-) Transcript_27117:1254-1985(-)